MPVGSTDRHRNASIGLAVICAGTILVGCSSVSKRAITTTVPTRAPGTTTTLAVPPDFRSVDWLAVAVPGAVCQVSHPVTLTRGTATIDTPPGVHAGTAQVVIDDRVDYPNPLVVYGDLYGPGSDVAALNVGCTNTGGMAAGQLQDSWVIYSARDGRLSVVATLTPQYGYSPDEHSPYFDYRPGGIEIQPNRITVHQLWYQGADGTCCPQGRAVTVWTLIDGRLTPTSTTATENNPSDAL